MMASELVLSMAVLMVLNRVDKMAANVVALMGALKADLSVNLKVDK